MKKILSLLLVLVLATGIMVGCSRNDVDGQASATKENNEAVETNKEEVDSEASATKEDNEAVEENEEEVDSEASATKKDNENE